MIELKKITGALLLTFALSGPAIAGEGHDNMSEMDGHKDKMGEMNKKSHGDKKAHMKMHHQSHMMTTYMLRNMAEILQGLNHKPSAADKEKLAEMITRLDAMIEKGKSHRNKKKGQMDGMKGHH